MSEKNLILPVKVKKAIRNAKIRELYKAGYTLEDICKTEKVSKTTAFFAVRGRSKKAVEKR